MIFVGCSPVQTISFVMAYMYENEGHQNVQTSFSTERLLSELCWLCYTQIFAGNTIHKNDLHQKWNKRLNDISKIKRLWRTLCHRASWLVRTGSLRKESDKRLQRNEKLWLMLLLNCWPRNFVNKQIWWVTFTCHFSVWAILFWLLPTFSSKSRC